MEERSSKVSLGEFGKRPGYFTFRARVWKVPGGDDWVTNYLNKTLCIIDFYVS